MFHRSPFHRSIRRTTAAVGLALVAASLAMACPFCTVESRTLTEEINSSAAVVLAKLVAEAQPAAVDADDNDPDAGKATFQIVDVLNVNGSGEKHAFKPGDQIKVVYFGEGERDKTFMISGVGVENDAVEWTTPLPLSETAIQYVRKLSGVPAAGAERLLFFQEYLENDDPLLAQDAYDEFARATYSELLELKDHLHHDKFVAWVQSPDVNPSRRRLYLTLLGICDDKSRLADARRHDHLRLLGEEADPRPDGLARPGAARPVGSTCGPKSSTSRTAKETRPRCHVGCYLVLRGPEGTRSDRRAIPEESSASTTRTPT